MRNLLTTILLVIALIVAILFAVTVTAVGIAAIGLLLHRWFELTVWQGSLIAMVAAVGFGFLLYRALTMSNLGSSSEWDEEEEEEQEEELTPEPPIVPWRRNRPTPGTLPPQQSPAREATPPTKKRK